MGAKANITPKKTVKKTVKKANANPTKSNKLKKLPKEAMIEALQKCLGIVSQAAKKAKIDRCTHYEWMKTDEDYKKRVEDIDNIAIDFAEGKMFQQIKNNDSGLIRFYLTTKAKHRGYTESQPNSQKTLTIKVKRK